uniref:(northern house mosquito) hypothetical protein n=1 Tax=Culex pipiens TaxID=7175 RepID=A0A8D8F5B9_CULPI
MWPPNLVPHPVRLPQQHQGGMSQSGLLLYQPVNLLPFASLRTSIPIRTIGMAQRNAIDTHSEPNAVPQTSLPQNFHPPQSSQPIKNTTHPGHNRKSTRYHLLGSTHQYRQRR